MLSFAGYRDRNTGTGGEEWTPGNRSTGSFGSIAEPGPQCELLINEQVKRWD
jgi:hypothetical protein